MPLQILALSNPIRTVQPFMTYMDDPTPFVALDLDTVKAAILYADHVRLRSYLIDVDAFAKDDSARDAIPPQFVNTVLSIALLAPKDVQRSYGIAPSMIPTRKRARAWRKEVIAIRKRVFDEGGMPLAYAFAVREEMPDDFTAFATEVAHKYVPSVARWREQLDLSGFEPAINKGLLTLSGWDDDPPSDESEDGYFERAFPSVLGELVAGDSVPMLDLGAQRTLAIKPAVSDAEVGGLLLSQLPEFRRASLRELIDIREELANPLVRFRSATTSLRQSVAMEDDGELAVRVRDAFTRDVVPSLAEIEERIGDNSYLGNLADSALRAETTIPSAVGLGIGLTALTGIAQLATAAAAASVAPARALREKLKEGRAIRRSDFYFLHQMRQVGRRRSP